MGPDTYFEMLTDSHIARGRHLWAKSDSDGIGHSLLGHLLDTGLVAAELLERRQDLEQKFVADELDMEPESAARLVMIVCALHDIGKAIPAFQVKWPEGAPAEVRGRRFTDIPHGRASGILLQEWLRRTGYRKRLSSSLANAAAIHHGRRLPASYNAPGTFDPRSLGSGSSRWEGWQTALMEDVSSAFGGLPETGYRRYLRGRTWALLAGLTSIADWIASSLSHAGPIADPAAYLASRREQVRVRLQEIEWPDSSAWYADGLASAGYSKLFFAGFQPRPLQSAMAELAGGADTPGLYVVEAPMGEGKTEAALFAAVQPVGRRGCYMALPTQATSDAMHARLAAFAERNQRKPLEISLAHSGARFKTLLPRTGEPADSETRESEIEAQTWFSQGRRELLTMLGVGTVDQALLGTLPAKHFFVRLWGLAGKTVILDEVHAYDTYTGSLITVLVEWLAAVDSTVVLMSATLPAAIKQNLVEAFLRGRGLQPAVLGGAREADAAHAYPVVVRADDRGPAARHFTARPQQPINLKAMPYGIEETGNLLLELRAHGGSVVAVVNTVGRAQELYRYCTRQGVDADLVHGRLPLAERQRRERQIVERYGPAGVPEGRAGLVIGTQVLEQSLDLDFDVMVSDLAPVDLLFQRAGRMHRHAGRERPAAFRWPQLYVAGLAGPESDTFDSEALQSVYSPFVLIRTALILQNRKHLVLPEDLHTLVQEVYGSGDLDMPDNLIDAYREAAREHNARVQADTATAAVFSIGRPHSPCTCSWGEAGSDIDAFERGTFLTPTRLFDDSVTVVPLLGKGSMWELPDGSASFSAGKIPRDAERFAVAAFGQQLRLQRKSLLPKLRAQDIPGWWQRSHLIRHFIPLFFTAEGTAVVDDSISWHPELGVVFGEGGQA